MITSNQIYNLVFVSIIAFFLCIALTKYSIKFLSAKNIVDHPSTRRAHTSSTPRGGGVAVILSFCIGCLLYYYITAQGFAEIIYLLLPLLLVSGISLYDDIHDVPIIVRLISHIASVVCVMCWLLPETKLLHDIIIPAWLDFALIICIMVTFLNVYNFMDGIDGITGAESMHLSVVLIALSLLRYEQIAYVDMVLLIASLLLVCSLAFLIYNWHPASIFIGDVGSIGLGFVISCAMLMVASSSLHLLLACFIAFGYYIGDGVLTILIRLFHGEKIWLPHLKHFFQQAARNGMHAKTITLKIMLCNLVLMCCSIAALYYPLISFVVGFLAVSVTILHFRNYGHSK